MSARLAVALLTGGWLFTACQGAPSAERRVGLPEPSNGLRESGPARFARTHSDFEWAVLDTDLVRLYAERGPGVDARLATLGEASDVALRQARAYVGRRSATGRISLFFVDSRERMGALLGRTPGGSALPKEDVAFFVAPPDGHVPALVHELAHLEAWEAFGERPLDEAWLDEGLATAAVGRCFAYSLDEAGAATLREGRAIPLVELAASFDVSDPAAYLQAGSVVAWVRERWGLDAVAALWRGGLAASEPATGLPPSALDAAWRAHVVENDAGTELDWESLQSEGCEASPLEVSRRTRHRPPPRTSAFAWTASLWGGCAAVGSPPPSPAGSVAVEAGLDRLRATARDLAPTSAPRAPRRPPAH